MMFFILVPILLPAQPATFRAGVTLVKVDAAVTDRSGRIIAGLTPQDFEVFDENAPQKILYFEHESDPLDLLLLLDVSGSMHPSLAQLSAAARAALRPLGSRDRGAVMLFARSSMLSRKLTADVAAVEREIQSASDAHDLGSGTAINAAILAAAAYFHDETSNARRAILIVTDNLSLNYRIPDEQVIRELYGADATLNAILIGKQRRPQPPKPGVYVNPDFTPADVFKLADATGGEALESRQAGESLQLMIERIRSRYRLQYEAPPAAPGQLRQIRVQLAPAARSRYPQAAIRARAGYYAVQ
ncbi:MAG TPA: VWA domain-containing protein [Bryobacteraceae bacterium]|jgi:VWFA-related protein|nr:VWA domain-containing protein [Bryobacteraceae bacterium]